MKYTFLLFITLFLFSGCSTQPSKRNAAKTSSTLFDSVIYDSKTQQVISLTELANKLADMDIIFLGEFHGHQASHWLQAKIQAELFAHRSKQILSMEQFERDHQEDVDAYLYSETGEKPFIKNSRAWPNYAGSYRPLIEFAKAHDFPIIAANAPQNIVRCIGRQGKAYLSKLSADEKATIARQPFLSDPDYEQKFSEFQQAAKHGKSYQNSYFAQLLRDNTMAESILKAHKNFPEAQILHTNGAFHSNAFLGTVALLKQRAPKLKIAVVSPVMKNQLTDLPELDDFKLGNFIYVILPLPDQYVSAENRRKAMKEMFEQADKHKCK